MNLAVASLLYQRLSALPEGDLSRVRANLVKQDTLHQLAVRLKVSEVLRLGEGEAKSGGQQRPSILADALEALIGAVYQLCSPAASAFAWAAMATSDFPEPVGVAMMTLAPVSRVSTASSCAG